MKTKQFFAIVALCTALAGGNLFAEDSPVTQGTPAAEGERKGRKDKFRESVPKETREKLQAARKAAMEDPNVVALQKQREYLDQQLQDAMRAAMVKSDPSLQPVLEQMKKLPLRGGGGGKDGKRFGGHKRDRHLPPEAREKLEQVKDDPAVKAAHEKLKAATTPEEKKAAWGELTAARKAALEKVDPDLAKRIEELHKGKPSE